jgi:hypothetical protein
MGRLAIAFVALAALAFAAPAWAGWSAPATIPGSGTSYVQAVAVNGRGDAAVVWSTTKPLYLTTRTASGRLTTRRLSTLPGEGTVAIDARGEVTAAWVTSKGVLARFGSLTGRWAPSRRLGSSAGEPRLAVATDGTVLLVWIHRFRGDVGGVFDQQLAWRTRGHRFGHAQTFTRPHPHLLESDPIYGAVPLFDAGGAAYLSARCDSIVRIAKPHSHRFSRPVALTSRPAGNISLAVSASGQGIASWGNGACSGVAGDGTFTPAFARVLRGGAFGPILEVLPAIPFSDVQPTAVALPDGAGSVTVRDDGVRVLTIPFAADGTPGSAQQNHDIAPVAADGGGDVVITREPLIGPPLVVVRPAGGAADQPAPSPAGTVATAAPVGRGVALAWNTNPLTGQGLLQLSVWRP